MDDNRSAPVVLIHGLGRGTGSMLPLAWRLNRRGWQTRRFGYPSTRSTLSDAVARVRAQLPDKPCHLVGHSLGGLVAAAVLRGPQGQNILSVVQLGSPNLGSVLASRVKGLSPIKWACGPAFLDVEALTPSPGQERPGLHPAAHPRIAAIAGTGGWPIPGTGLERPHDGAVSVRSATAGAAHCALVPVLHTLLPASGRVAHLVDRVLATGQFPEDNT